LIAPINTVAPGIFILHFYPSVIASIKNGAISVTPFLSSGYFRLSLICGFSTVNIPALISSSAFPTFFFGDITVEIIFLRILYFPCPLGGDGDKQVFGIDLLQQVINGRIKHASTTPQ